MPQLTDVSTRAVSIAREIDRLPPGQYMLVLVKPDLTGQPWSVEYIRTEPLRSVELPRRDPPALACG